MREGQAAQLTVRLSAPSEETVTVQFATQNGSATVIGGDYDPVSGTLTFAPGQTELTVVVQTNADQLDEPDEVFSVRLDGATNASIADDRGEVTIQDDFAPPPPAAQISINPVAGDDNVALGEVDGVPTLIITGTVGGDARPGDTIRIGFGDEQDPNEVLFTTVLPGNTFQVEVPVAVILDNDTVRGSVSGQDDFGQPYEADAERSYDIDIPQKIVSVSDETEVEGDDLVFEVSLHPLSVYADQGVHTFALTDITTSPADYGSISFSDGVVDNGNGTITVPAGLTAFTVTVAGAQDLVEEDNETFILSIDGVDGATGLGTILDDETLQVNVSADGPVEEGGLAKFTVALTVASAQAQTVNLSLADGTADSSDYDNIQFYDALGQPISSALVFAPGETSKDVYVRTIDNDPPLNEPLENFTFTGELVGGNSDSAQGQITDSDRPVVQISGVQGDGTTVEEGELAQFTVTLN
ncbi:MAG: hypothetical protein CME59_09025, partial [Halioglobus sp.]|nr:hypothetical protein [Halioglobus sp.]